MPKAVKLEAAASASPYAEFKKPLDSDCARVCSALGALHGTPTPGETVMPVLDSLVRTVLSQNTTDKNSRAAFASLKAALPTWRLVYESRGTTRLEESIKCGGLSEIKARNVQAILHYLLTDHRDKCVGGEPSYCWLRQESTDFIKAELLKHKGVGPKTVSCVLMFNLQRAEFPVDTHVLHITKKLGWVPGAATAETAYLHLNSRVPDALKYPLHVLLVEHGKRCRRCAKGALQLPEEGPCPLAGAASPAKGLAVAVEAEAEVEAQSNTKGKGKGKRVAEEWDAAVNESKQQETTSPAPFSALCGNDCDDLFRDSKKKLRHTDMQ